MIEKLQHGVPYVFVKTAIQDIHPISFIGQDSVQSGLVCGKLMSLYIHRPALIAVILSVQDDTHIRRRADGFQSAFLGSPGISSSRKNNQKILIPIDIITPENVMYYKKG